MSEDYQLVDYPDQPTIRLQEFEGPLDLLLHLIRKAEVDIYDIPIAAITKQYVDFLAQQRANRINVAGEYFVLAATLMAIKSALLLPKPPVPEPEAAQVEEDPREELVAQLLEYERYKQAAAKLKDREHHRRQEYTRPAMNVPAGLVTQQFAPGVSLEQLTAAFAAVVKRHAGAVVVPPQTVDPDPVTVADRIKAVLRLVDGPTRFEDLFEDEWSRDRLVTTFLALLDLAKHQAVLITQAVRFGPLIVAPGPRNEEYRHG